jgi:processive 1,2-diacylglycerol beta-glucosyltransferase
VLVLTARIGRGHLAIARGLRQSLARQGARVTIRSPINDAPLLRRLPELYCYLTRSAPATWERYYQIRSRHGFAHRTNSRLVRHLLSESVLYELASQKYDSVILTTSLYCHCLQDFEDRIPATVLVTDLFGGPTEWFLPGARRYIVPTGFMNQQAAAHSLADESVLTRRLPTMLPRDEAVSFDNSCRLKVLVVGGSGGIGPIEAVASGLAKSGLEASITLVCGTNRRLEEKLRRRFGGRFEVQGFVRGLGRRLRKFDFVVTKPGSASLMELFESAVPFAMMPGIPGIEDGNERELMYWSIPMLRDERSTEQAIRGLFEQDGTFTLAGENWREHISLMRTTLPARELTYSDVI